MFLLQPEDSSVFFWRNEGIQVRTAFALDTVFISHWGLQTQWEAQDKTEDATQTTPQLANWPKVRCTVPRWGCGWHNPLGSEARGDSGIHRAVTNSTSQINKDYSEHQLKPFLRLSRVVYSSSRHRCWGLQCHWEARSTRGRKNLATKTSGHMELMLKEGRWLHVPQTPSSSQRGAERKAEDCKGIESEAGLRCSIVWKVQRS